MKEKLPKKIISALDDEYLSIVGSILTNKEYCKRKEYHHHENRSVYAHCLLVSVRSYKIAKILGLDYKTAAIAGLLHDFYDKDWQLSKEKTNIRKAHGFRHAQEAVKNSYECFPDLMNKKIENSILRHMFPLNFIPPVYLEGWIICLVDKYCSCEIFSRPKNLYKYVGLKKKGGADDE